MLLQLGWVLFGIYLMYVKTMLCCCAEAIHVILCSKTICVVYVCCMILLYDCVHSKAYSMQVIDGCVRTC